MKMFRAAAAVGLAFLLSSLGNAQEDRGAYLAQIMDCGGCHTPGSLMGKPI